MTVFLIKEACVEKWMVLEGEVTAILETLERNKSPGVGGIPREASQATKNESIKTLIGIALQIWNVRQWCPEANVQNIVQSQRTEMPNIAVAIQYKAFTLSAMETKRGSKFDNKHFYSAGNETWNTYRRIPKRKRH